MRRAAALGVIALVVAGCGGDADVPRGDPVAGERLVDEVEPSCGRCHTLQAAGWEGAVAPNLDDLRPGYGRVLNALREGPGLMPSFEGLDEQEQHDIAAYVSDAAAR